MNNFGACRHIKKQSYFVSIPTFMKSTSYLCDTALPYLFTIIPFISLSATDFFFGCDEDLIGPETPPETTSGADEFVVISATRNCDCDNGVYLVPPSRGYLHSMASGLSTSYYEDAN